jgi:sugar phosphate permease
MPREDDDPLMPPADLQPSSVPKRRWGIALLLGFGVLVNYFDRVNLSVSRDALHTTFGISTVMFGYLLSAYNWTYAVLQLPSGLLLDRFGVRRVGIVSTMVWSVASFGAAVSTGIGGMCIAISFGGRRSSDVSWQCESHWLLVSGKRAESGDSDV